MERVKYNRVEVNHGNMAKKFPVYEIYLDGVIVTKVSSENEALEMVSRWQEIYKYLLKAKGMYMYRPPKVRPKNLTIGGRYFYGKI